MHELFDLTAADGTRLTAWRNRAEEGPRVLVCNGMGVPPQAWPRLIDDDCRYQVASWNQRGVLGSDIPADPTRIQIGDHVEDAVALLDHLGWDEAVVVGWSLGVNVAFELVRAHPARVSGILSVAGVPGGTFDTVLATLPLPRGLRRPLGKGIVQAGRLVAPQLNALTRMLGERHALAEVVRFSGMVLPTARAADVRPWAEAMFSQEWAPYFELALALERHDRVDPSFVEVPVTVVAGELDALTAHDDVKAFACQIPHAEFLSLRGSHCLPLEFPEGMVSLVDALVARIEADRAGRDYLRRFESVPAVIDEAASPEILSATERAWFGDRPRSPRSPRSERPWWASDPEPATA